MPWQGGRAQQLDGFLAVARRALAVAQQQGEVVLGHRQVGCHGLAVPFDGLGRIALDHEAALVHHGDVERRLRRTALGRAQQPAGAGLLVLGHAHALDQPAGQFLHGDDFVGIGLGAQLVDRHRRPVGRLGRLGRGRWRGWRRVAAGECRRWSVRAAAGRPAGVLKDDLGRRRGGWRRRRFDDGARRGPPWRPAAVPSRAAASPRRRWLRRPRPGSRPRPGRRGASPATSPTASGLGLWSLPVIPRP